MNQAHFRLFVSRFFAPMLLALAMPAAFLGCSDGCQSNEQSIIHIEQTLYRQSGHSLTYSGPLFLCATRSHTQPEPNCHRIELKDGKAEFDWNEDDIAVWFNNPWVDKPSVWVQTSLEGQPIGPCSAQEIGMNEKSCVLTNNVECYIQDEFLPTLDETASSQESSS